MCVPLGFIACIPNPETTQLLPLNPMVWDSLHGTCPPPLPPNLQSRGGYCTA